MHVNKFNVQTAARNSLTFTIDEVRKTTEPSYVFTSRDPHRRKQIKEKAVL